MKILKSRYANTGEGYHTQTFIVWYLQLEDKRKVTVSEWQDWEGSRLNCWVSDLEEDEGDLADRCSTFVEDRDYGSYEDFKRYSKKVLLKEAEIDWAEEPFEDYLLDPELDPELND